MNNGMRIAAQGMNALALKHGIIATNLANVNTTGYKSDLAITKSFQSFFDEQLGLKGGGIEIDKTAIRFEQGALTPTGNKFDFALEGEGFFVVQTENGERLTRNGSFGLNSNRELVTKDGYSVMGRVEQ